MGCAISRIDDSEVVMRCKNRKRLMKKAVDYRQDFAIAHIAYLQALKSIGISLRVFAEGGSADVQASPGSPTTVLSPPQTSSPSAAALSPPLQASIPSSPPSPSPDTAALPPASTPPSSPPLSPPPPASTPSPPGASTPSTPGASSPPPASNPTLPPPPPPPPPLPPPPPPPNFSPHVEMSRSMSMPLLRTENKFAYPERSPIDSPFYSPRGEEIDDLDLALPPPPLPPNSLISPPAPSPPRNSPWAFLDIFDPAPIPFHLQEQRRMKQMEEVAEEEDLEQVREEEGIPDLEEEEQKIEEKEEQEPNENVTWEVELEENAVEEEPEERLEKLTEIDEEQVLDKVEEIEEEEDPVVAMEEDMEEEAALEVEKKEIEMKEEKQLVFFSAWKGKSLIEIIRHIENQFNWAHESGKDVSGMLETHKFHHHLSFSDLKDSAKVFNAITWHWSNKTPLPLKEVNDDNEMVECGMTGSHASTLERLYAWEKKLYDEVKVGELFRIAFHRKCQQLRSLDAKGEDTCVIDKTRASIKSLDTRLIVTLHAIHSISLRIQRLTNEELYLQLAELLGGLKKMWAVMLECHKTQYEIALEMKNLHILAADDEASDAHRKATFELENELNKWQSCFSQWIVSQQRYIDALHQWLRLCHMKPETDNKGKVVSPFWGEGPKNFALIKDWHQSLERLKNKSEVLDAIDDFASVVHSLRLHQSEELRQKRRAEGLAKDLDRKTLSLQNMEKKYVESPDSDDRQDLSRVRSTARNNIQERRAALNSFRNRVEEEKQKHLKVTQARRDTTLGSLKTNLPSIFDAMSSFATAAIMEYDILQQVAAESINAQPSDNA